MPIGPGFARKVLRLPLTALLIVLPWLLVGFGCWLGYQLAHQNGRILLRLEALEKSFEQISTGGLVQTPVRKSGLLVGSTAPEFELPDLSGIRQGLSDFRGRRVLLIFFSPHCGFCTGMAPDLAALAPDGRNGQPMPLVVTTGDVNTNRQIFQKYEIHCPVLLQEDRKVASQYHAHGTPMGYLIDEQGAIASDLTAGAPALLALATASDERKGPQTPKVRGNKSLDDSRLNRTGLKAGTPAPGFRLPPTGRWGVDARRVSRTSGAAGFF